MADHPYTITMEVTLSFETWQEASDAAHIMLDFMVGHYDTMAGAVVKVERSGDA